MADADILWDYPLEDTSYGRILLRTVERVKSLNLPCIGPEKVELRKLAWAAEKDELQPPYIIVSPRAEVINWRDGTNERDAIGYAAMFSIVLANTRDVSIRGMGLQIQWRNLLRKSFHNKTQKDWPDLSFDGLGNVAFNHSFIEAGDQFIPEAKRVQLDAQWQLVRFNVWEPRT